MEDNRINEEQLDQVAGGINNLNVNSQGGNGDGSGGDATITITDNSTNIVETNYYK